jgi:hypothetical protein
MREPSMKWFFESRRNGGGDNGGGRDRPDEAGPDAPRPGEDDFVPGQIDLPPAVLERHGAVVLDPGRAVTIPGWPAPRSTVYRARTLLVPEDLLQDPDFVAAINAVLAGVGMTLVPPSGRSRPPVDDNASGTERSAAEVLRRLPRTAVLVPAIPADGRPAHPVVVDAWVALQALRAAATAARDSAPEPVLAEEAVARIALEHLLVGSAITGSPIGGHGGGLASDSSGVTGPGATDSYVYSGGDTRAPVAVLFDKPWRMKAAECTSAYGRRLVLAVADTGLRAHTWLDVAADPAGGYQTVDDGFAAVDDAIQQAIYQEGQQAVAAGDRPRMVIRHPWDTPITADPLVGELDTDTGHGTFIAGIVRQVAPDAQVLAVRIMHGDGVVTEGDLICALSQLAQRIAFPAEGDPALTVDVLSLSLGYFSESGSAAATAYSSGVWHAIQVLLSLGVIVVAAAGNYSTRRRYYPAAFAGLPADGPVPLISVGALNPNGSKALFSDDGSWITAWAPGAAVVSTFPEDINGSRCPEIRMRAQPGNELPAGGPAPGQREALDPDDYAGGFAVWSGTSFSAPLLAAHIARSLLEGAADATSGHRLSVPGPAAAAARAVAALQSMGWGG